MTTTISSGDYKVSNREENKYMKNIMFILLIINTLLVIFLCMTIIRLYNDTQETYSLVISVLEATNNYIRSMKEMTEDIKSYSDFKEKVNVPNVALGLLRDYIIREKKDI